MSIIVGNVQVLKFHEYFLFYTNSCNKATWKCLSVIHVLLLAFLVILKLYLFKVGLY